MTFGLGYLQPENLLEAMDPIRYTLRFPSPHTHYVEVTAEVPATGTADVELMMAIWTPGSYLIREYARHVERVSASSRAGEPLPARKTAKNRWTIRADGAAIVVTYRIYGREMSVRTNWIEAGFALINGAPTFLTLVESARRPHEVCVEMPASWVQSVTALPRVPGQAHCYRAADFDTLVDSPLLLGSPASYDFKVSGRPHRLVNEGEVDLFDGARAAADLAAIVRAHHRFWGVVPYDDYVLINLMTEAGGGLEHANSAVLMTSRWATRTRQAYLGWLELASHELFHVWNGKRLRPVELGPFDYEREAHTHGLWVVEGITDYFGDLLVHRAGLSSVQELLDSLSDKIEALHSTPGREVQSVTSASFDAWIKFYRPDENTPNTAISYYVKGAVIAFLLDARIRAATGGARSLDDVMREAYGRYSGPRGFTEPEFRALVEEVAGTGLDGFWASTLDSTEELDYADALAWLGLRFKPVPDPVGRTRAWLGASTRVESGRLLVSQVRRSTPAHDGGLNVDDEILAVDGIRVRPDQLDHRLEQYAAGATIAMLVARRDRLLTLALTLGAEPPRAWRLEVDPAASPAPIASLAAWLGE